MPPKTEWPRIEWVDLTPTDPEPDPTMPKLIATMRKADAFDEIAPHLDRLRPIAKRLNWTLGRNLVELAVEQLERDHPPGKREIELRTAKAIMTVSDAKPRARKAR